MEVFLSCLPLCTHATDDGMRGGMSYLANSTELHMSTFSEQNLLTMVAVTFLKSSCADFVNCDNQKQHNFICLMFNTTPCKLIEYKHILAALIDSEQTLLSIEVQLCTRRECKTFRPRRPSSVAMHKVRVRLCH